MDMGQSSAARGREVEGIYPLPYWPTDQNAEWEKYHVFSTPEIVFCFGIDSKMI